MNLPEGEVSSPRFADHYLRLAIPIVGPKEDEESIYDPLRLIVVSGTAIGPDL